MLHVRWGTVLCAALAAALVAGACGGRKAQLNLPPPSDPVDRKVSGVLLDAKTGRMVLKPVKLSVRDATGALSSLARDGQDQVQNQLEVATGVFAFAVSKAAPLPVKLTVVAVADGYFTASGDVEFTADGEQQLVLRFVAVAAPPAGVAAVQVTAGSASSTGVVAAPVLVSTPAEPVSGGVTEVAIPAATKITAADGTPLVGEITASASYFASTEATALSSFPGGLEVAVAPTSGGAASEGSFVSGGFAAIELRDSTGKLAASFDKPVEISITVAPGTVNPETGLPVKAGDTIPFWSYSETTGQWQAEGTLTIQDDGQGGLRGVGSVTHLSYFNLDWWEQRCAQDVHIVVAGNPEQRPLVVELERQGGGWYRELYSTVNPNDIVLHNAPATMPVDVRVKYNGAVVGTATVANVCSTTPIPVTVKLPSIAAASLEVSVFSACIQDPTTRAAEPSATVAVYRTSQIPTVQSTDGSGVARFSGLAAGYAYNVSVTAMDGSSVLLPKLLAAGANKVEAFLMKDCPTTGATGGSGR